METSELRLGNWIELRPDHTHRRYIEVSRINRGSVGNKTTRFETDNPRQPSEMKELFSQYLFPIPLTDEIIQRCGFEVRYNGIKTYYNPLMELDYEFNLMRYESNVKINYVHQLQNIYFALTNTELDLDIDFFERGH